MPCEGGGRSGPDYYDEIVRLACLYCKSLERQQLPIPKWARAWWEQHKEYDRQRLQRAKEERERRRTRRAALAKLTPNERKALGVRQ